MSDFTLESDALEPERRTPPRLVSTGLADTAEVSRRARGKAREVPPAYAPCPSCGAPVLTGATPAGERLALDTQVKSYVPLWLSETPRPVLHESRGYPVHHCAPGLAPFMSIDVLPRLKSGDS